MDRNPGPAGTGPDEGLHAAIAAEFDNAVDHARKDLGLSVGDVGGEAGQAVIGGIQRIIENHLVEADLLVADIRFEPETAEIVADLGAGIPAGLLGDHDEVFDTVDFRIVVFGEHRTAFDADIGCVVRGHRGCREGCGRQRQDDERFPHYRFLLPRMPLRTRSRGTNCFFRPEE